MLAKRLKRGFTYNVLLHMAYKRSYPLFSKQYARGCEIGLFDHAHRIIAVSNYVARSVEGFIDARKLAVAHNGVKVERFHFRREFRQRERKRLGIADDELVLLTTSALSVQKNITKIFPALGALIHKGVKLRYLIAGYRNKTTWHI